MTEELVRGTTRPFPPEGLVFAFDDETLSYNDLAVVAMLCGEWTSFVETSGLGSHLATCRQVDGTALRQQAERFRRARQLVAAEDLRSWLEARSLSRDEWRSSMERSAALSADNVPPMEHDVTEATQEALNVDAFCMGLWETSSLHAVNWLAAARIATEVDHESQSDRTSVERFASEIGVSAIRVEAICDWRSAFESVRKRLASDEAIERLVRMRELEWTSFDFDHLTVETRSAAYEALLCLRDDGIEMEEIVVRSGGRLTSRSARSNELPAPVAAEMLTVPVDVNVIEPFENSEGWSVLKLTDRRRPVSTDPDVRAAAVAELLAETLTRESAGHVSWIGPV